MDNITELNQIVNDNNAQFLMPRKLLVRHDICDEAKLWACELINKYSEKRICEVQSILLQVPLNSIIQLNHCSKNRAKTIKKQLAIISNDLIQLLDI